MYQAGPDYGDHLVEIYRSNNLLMEDIAATGRGRNTFIVYESNHVTLRRCWGRYVINGTNQGADWLQVYGSSDTLIENCVGTRLPSTILVDAAQYWLASWNTGYTNNRNRITGSVALGHDYHGLNIISAGGQLSGNSIDNSVFIGSTTGQGFGVPFTGIFQRADNSFNANRVTLVGHQTGVSQSHDTSNPLYNIYSTVRNSSIVNSSVGLSSSNYAGITVGMEHRFNNFWNVTQRYGGTISTGANETAINPVYDTAQYGNGAYLFVPAALKGKGESGVDIGADLRYLTDGTRMWPWAMEARICAETANLLGGGASVTYEQATTSYDYDGNGTGESYTCSGGIWRTLNGVY